MAPDPLPPTPNGAPESGDRLSQQLYRSVADGELKVPWTLSEYFASLNTVFRLPAKVRRRAEEVARRTPGGAALLASIERIRIPKSLVYASFALAVIVLVVRPLLLDASGSDTHVDLSKTYGVWGASKGKYQNRAFELKADSVGFSEDIKSAQRTWYPVTSAEAKPAGDSTLYTLNYLQSGKNVEFAFWYVQEGQPSIHLKNLPTVTWTKTVARAPAARH